MIERLEDWYGLCSDERHIELKSSEWKMNKKHYDVLVVGGGMVGAAIASGLGQHGFTVAVFEQRLPGRFVSEELPDIRVSALSKASENLLQTLGAWDKIQSMRMCPYRRMAVWEKLNGMNEEKRFNQTLFQAADAGYEELGFIVENRITQSGLLETLKTLNNVDVYCPAIIDAINVSDPKKPSVQLEDGSLFSGDLLVGADGARSRVREAAGIRMETREYEQQCLVATVEIPNPGQDITWQAFTPTGPEALLPLPDVAGRSYASIVWYHQPESVRRLMTLSDRSFIKELTMTFPQELPEIRALHERGFFPLARRHAVTYFRPGVVLAGDAAHTINPLAGQGVNLGFQDVAWLVQTLIDAQQHGEALGSKTVLARYEKARWQDNLMMMQTMDAFYHAFSNNSLPLKVVRNLALTLAGKTRPAVTQIMKYAMGVTGKQPQWVKEPILES